MITLLSQMIYYMVVNVNPSRCFLFPEKKKKPLFLFLSVASLFFYCLLGFLSQVIIIYIYIYIYRVPVQMKIILLKIENLLFAKYII